MIVTRTEYFYTFDSFNIQLESYKKRKDIVIVDSGKVDYSVEPALKSTFFDNYPKEKNKSEIFFIIFESVL